MSSSVDNHSNPSLSVSPQSGVLHDPYVQRQLPSRTNRPSSTSSSTSHQRAIKILAKQKSA